MDAHATPRTLLVTVVRLVAQHDAGALVRIVTWMVEQLGQFNAVDSDAADYVLTAILYELRLLAREHPEPVGAHRAALQTLAVHRHQQVSEAAHHCLDALDGVTSRYERR